MAELFLKFEDQVLQELLLSGGTVTIGRQPDNVFRIDNPAVSGHHARVSAEGDQYVIEDVESFNGTYVNGQRISKVVLKHGDNVTIGKHTIEFRDEVRQIATPYGIVNGVGGQLPKPPQLDPTMVLDTAKAKEMLTQAAAASSAGSVVVRRVGIGQSQSPVNTTPVIHQAIGTLTIVKGRTDQQRYVLTGKLTLIGKSKMAGIRLKRWFAPRVAALIYRSEDGYFIAASESKIPIRVNDVVVDGGQKQLEAGDVIELADIKAVFAT
ncbi:MAG TPA: FHA domain-containing protein [Terriglobales bacterium]|jgi:pSer/pThr/pTyr-binding forkhead associated (FHA) protein|nr:FHA domain-containing protein [Terriglobales bacterium]